MTKLRVTLKRSTIGLTNIQKAQLNGLGLKKTRQVRELENTPSVRGMIKKVLHLVDVTEIPG